LASLLPEKLGFDMMFTKVLETFLKDFGPLNDGIAQLLQI
jgi:hypothetical protein